jgi:uncharacterized protein YbaR (Trm112 family)
MPLDADLKALLVCPRCKGELEFHEDRGEIHCLKCRLLFALVDDLPHLLVDEAKPLEGP